jgi:hypothetical protein
VIDDFSFDSQSSRCCAQGAAAGKDRLKLTSALKDKLSQAMVVAGAGLRRCWAFTAPPSGSTPRRSCSG